MNGNYYSSEDLGYRKENQKFVVKNKKKLKRLYELFNIREGFKKEIDE